MGLSTVNPRPKIRTGAPVGVRSLTGLCSCADTILMIEQDYANKVRVVGYSLGAVIILAVAIFRLITR